MSAESLTTDPYETVLADLEREMMEAAEALEFERAALLRDQIRELKSVRPVPRGAAEKEGEPSARYVMRRPRGKRSANRRS